MTRTVVYRHYDAEGRLLYVGAARSFGNRTQTHLREAEWVSQSVRAEAVFYPTREEALDAEMAAIRSEKPIYNAVRNGRSLAKPPKRATKPPVETVLKVSRDAFRSRWAEYLRGKYESAYAVHKAFPGLDEKTCRDWWNGKAAPSGCFVAAVVAADPAAIETLGRTE